MLVPPFTLVDDLARSREAADAHAIATAIREGRLTRPPTPLRDRVVVVGQRLARALSRPAQPARPALPARPDLAADVTP